MANEVRVEMNVPAVIERKRAALQRSQVALDVQVVKDSNLYCPEAEGTLKKSALTASDFGKGIVRWATPYAARLYYNPQFNFSKDRNPDAQGKWFEAAKARHLRDWQRKAQEALG